MTIESRKRRGFALLGAGAALLALAGCASLGGRGSALPPADAHAKLFDARGADRGRVDVYREGRGLRIELVARGFGPGTYGMHVHAVGQCRKPDFASAGPHWNPGGAQHGRENPLGAHHGDLPNLVVEADEIGRATVTLPQAQFAGENGLFDADGAAFVIHAEADDMRTDPSGNSGARIACGVFFKGDAER